MSFLNKMRQQKLLSMTLLLFTLSIGIVIGTVISTGVKAAKAQSVAPDATPLTIPSPAQLSNEFSKLAKLVEPSVVNISTDYTAKPQTSQRRRQTPGDDESDEGMDLFRRFFRGQPSPFDDLPQRQFRREATGSGFIVDKNGYILTNKHVIERADHIKVKIPGDKTEYKAKLIGSDTETDLAIIKIDAGHGLPALRIGNSEGVQVGDWAVAIGSPFGLEASVTAGIISATGRDIAGAQQFQRFIQTDAAINPGNSGGPLLNIRGEAIGVNTAIATQTGGYQGIGFALPMNTAVKVYNSIIRSGRVTRGSIGVSFGKNDKPEVLRALGLKNGVLVQEVQPGGPSEKAGLKAEDVIVAMNGKPIQDGDDLVARVADTPIGEDVKLTVDRSGKKMDFSVTVGDRTQVFADRFRDERDEPATKTEGTQAKFGIYLRNLTENERNSMNLTEKNGVLITRVEPGSFADDIGLQEKDVVVSVNRQPVTSVDDVKRIQGTLKSGDAVAFRVMRPTGVAVRPGQPGGGRQQAWVSFFAAGTLPPQ